VPIAEARTAVFSVSFRENRRLDMLFQGRERADT